MNDELVSNDISEEQYREYDFGGRVYRIDAPVCFVMRRGGSTHRVVDGQGVVHCVPAPGHQGCVLRWKSKDPSRPVQF